MHALFPLLFWLVKKSDSSSKLSFGWLQSMIIRATLQPLDPPTTALPQLEPRNARRNTVPSARQHSRSPMHGPTAPKQSWASKCHSAAVGSYPVKHRACYQTRAGCGAVDAGLKPSSLPIYTALLQSTAAFLREGSLCCWAFLRSALTSSVPMMT